MHPNEPYESLEIIAPGQNDDGFWTNKDLVNHIRTKAIPVFKLVHPNCISLFIFDNSQNHHVLLMRNRYSILKICKVLSNSTIHLPKASECHLQS